MESLKVKIECSEKELNLIERALDFYSRVGVGQFSEIAQHPTFDKTLKEVCTEENGEVDYGKFHKRREGFCKEAARLKEFLTGEYHGQHGSYGIFNKKVDKSCVEAYDMYQSIRHARWKQQEDRMDYTNSAFPNDACQIARIEPLNFKVEIDETTSKRTSRDKKKRL